MPEVYGVFEGGGVRGTALVGGVAAAEEKGITFRAVAGTSAGAIVASLIAAGYNAAEMRAILMDTDLKKFMDPHSPIPGIQHAMAWRKLGLHKGEYFRNWIRECLSRKIFETPNRSPTFADLNMPLTVIATDLISQEMKVISSATHPTMPVADAVRMSMSIPVTFQPVRTLSELLVDGGAVSNFPAWAFDEDQRTSRLPIFGLRLQPDDLPPNTVITPFQFILSLFFTMMKASIPIQNSRVEGLNVIDLPTLNVSTTNFGISQELKKKLYEEGYNYAKRYLETLELVFPVEHV